jgi:hypothetical protein
MRFQKVPPYRLCNAQGIRGRRAPMRNPWSMRQDVGGEGEERTDPVENGVLSCEESGRLWPSVSFNRSLEVRHTASERQDPR